MDLCQSAAGASVRHSLRSHSLGYIHDALRARERESRVPLHFGLIRVGEDRNEGGQSEGV